MPCMILQAENCSITPSSPTRKLTDFIPTLLASDRYVGPLRDICMAFKHTKHKFYPGNHKCKNYQ